MATLRTVSFLAVRDLKRDKKIAALVICLLAFSYINITFFAAFINGLGNTFQEEIVNTATSHIIITPSENNNMKYVPSISSLRKKIELNPEVKATTVHLSVPITISAGTRQSSVAATGVQASDESQVTVTPTYLIAGSFLSDNSNDEIVLGRFIAGERIEDTIGRQRFGQLITGLGVTVGETVHVKYANGIERTYRVRGIVGSEGFSTVSQSAFITLHEAEEVLGVNDQASSLLVRLDDKYRAPAVKKFIIEQGVRNVEVRTWEEASSFVGAINSTFGIVVLATSFVGIMIVVVTIGIVIFINTSRKKRIIGVLKAIGMSDTQVMAIFLFEALLFGVAGAAIGAAAFSGVNYIMTINPIQLPVGPLKPVLGIDVVLTSAFLIIIASVVAGYVPARMAARQKIMETIKTVE